MDEAHALMDRHRQMADKLTQKELGILEQRIREAVRKREMLAGGSASEHNETKFKKTLEEIGVNTYEWQGRSRLTTLHEAADPMWDLIQSNQLTYSAAIRLVTKARCLTLNNKCHLVESVKKCLADYYKGDEHSIRVILPSGKVAMKHKRLSRAKPEVLANGPKNASDFWGAVKALAHQFVDERLAEVSEIKRAEISNRFMADLRTIYGELLKSVSYGRKMTDKPVPLVNISILRRACERLNIEMPKFGKPIADQKGAHKQFRKLSARFHSDHAGNDPKMVEQFQAVQDAWEIVKGYQERFQ